jgi:hypothetical protein
VNNDPNSRLDIYKRILATSDADDHRRTHTRTQEGKPHQAKQWLTKARRITLVSRLIAHDERFAS